MKKIKNILMYVIITISVVMTIYFFMDAHEPRAGHLLLWAYILLGFGILLLITIPILNIGTNPGSLKKGAMSIAFMVVLFGIAFLFASDAQTPTTAAMINPPPPSATTMRITDAGLLATYLLLVIAVCSILFASLFASLKKR